MTFEASPPASLGPSGDSKHGVSTDEAVATLDAVLEPFGGCAEDREMAILWLLSAETLGQSRFGIAMLARELRSLTVSNATESQRVHEIGAVVAIDAAELPGILALALASRTAIRSLEACGASVVGMRNVGATGILGFAARRIASHGAVALVMAESGPIVAPWGGTGPAIGTNPIAMATPRQGQSPFVVDFATAPMTLAEVRQREDVGQSLPEGVAVAADGTPTDDPHVMAALLPEGKVSSLTGLMVQMLAGVATGSATGPLPRDRYSRRGVSLISFRPPNEAAAQDSANLLESWRGAGGHVPARLDGVPMRLVDLPPELRLEAPARQALRDLATSSH